MSVLVSKRTAEDDYLRTAHERASLFSEKKITTESLTTESL